MNDVVAKHTYSRDQSLISFHSGPIRTVSVSRTRPLFAFAEFRSSRPVVAHHYHRSSIATFVYHFSALASISSEWVLVGWNHVCRWCAHALPAIWFNKINCYNQRLKMFTISIFDARIRDMICLAKLRLTQHTLATPPPPPPLLVATVMVFSKFSCCPKRVL